ncbi:hypothetical protein MJO28_004497 [Puccinia striiformis f. sp. tritici]|uniref:Uncharacterized protein n=1 Tax=Puccinia striiformis f. sp. tritici TaxID=168172 RepID=A0ACC0ESM1_9BASI|nr:hypothetical protein Pst134EA_006931 [Puccinia striiformis f. sp. tritici]KAH9469643.1 hypothetical protein Pst134EA_006931 [Puccinia striiformis f. sp. tritici]KAI7957402.1 hypothetical protein MJO28_004497 [Puccinia striiformis f. sp. tritici]
MVSSNPEAGASNPADMELDQSTIDEGLYSRQLYVLGHDAMQKMANSDVLIVGMKGLGVEIAKNICLAGVKSVTIHDPAPTCKADLGCQFFLRDSDIGKPRDQSTQPRMAELNSYVPVRVLGKELTKEVLKSFQVVVLTNTPLLKQLEFNDFTHQNGIKFISTDSRGLFGSVFCDFGPEFVVLDATGEQPVSGMVVSIENSAEGLVTTLDESRHGLEDGDYVTFTEVEGMDALIKGEPRKVTVKGPYTFTIGDTTSLGNYKKGGWFHQAKQPKVLQFKSLRESLAEPEYLITDFAKFDRPAVLHTGFQALSEFQEKHQRLPKPRNPADAESFLTIAKSIHKGDDELPKEVLSELAYQATGELAPINAVIGGYVAQEVLKACSGKFHPTFQYLYFDALEALPNDLPTETDVQPIGSRYDSQIAVFGNEFQKKISNYRQFLVGAGAIGCEMLKNWAMMGLAAGPEGKISVTDMDSIEKSNLNRQFLFRPRDLGSFKSEAAPRAVTEMNPDLQGKIQSFQEAVGDRTEHLFGDEFFDHLDCVTNALDNVLARQYMDRRCVYYEKPLLESGTLGTKANVQVVLPHLTESYSSSQDPPEKEAPMCTVKSFPNIIEHTIQWAKERFSEFFTKPAETINQYLTIPNYIDTLRQGGNPIEQIHQIQEFLVDNRPSTFDDCVRWSRLKFELEFNNEIRQLLHSLPRDLITKEGVPFWSGPKRAPEPIEFNPDDAQHMRFVIAGANLLAFNYGIKGERNPSTIKELVSKVNVPEFVPRAGMQVQVKDDEPVANQGGGDGDQAEIMAKLPDPKKLTGLKMKACEFEKDDDTNFHMDFITAASNLRAINYSITPVDTHRTKLIAGRIIPAIATTTALATGLVCIELYKIIAGKNKLEDFKNGFVNLALPFFGFSEPIAAAKNKYYDTEWTLWDRFNIDYDITLQELIDFFKNEKKLEVTMLSSGVSMLYSSFMAKKKVEERLKMKMSELVETVSKKPVPAHVKAMIFEVMVNKTEPDQAANDDDDDDVEVPYIKIRIRA